jgi:YggT family protein
VFRCVKDAGSGHAAALQGRGAGGNRRRGRGLSPRTASGYSSGRPALDTFMNPFLWLIDTLITLYIWLLIASAVLSWLIAFNVVNMRNQYVALIADFLYRVTEPALRPIRSVLPSFGGIDISPVILIIGLLFLQRILYWLLT